VEDLSQKPIKPGEDVKASYTLATTFFSIVAGQEVWVTVNDLSSPGHPTVYHKADAGAPIPMKPWDTRESTVDLGGFNHQYGLYQVTVGLYTPFHSPVLNKTLYQLDVEDETTFAILGD
jgi:hypothetical protein